MQEKERRGLREYAKRYIQMVHSPKQEEKRRLWRNLNSLVFERPLIYIRKVPYGEFFDEGVLQCEDPFLRRYEHLMATQVFFHDMLDDDFTHLPYLSVDAATEDVQMRWGMPCSLGEKTEGIKCAAFESVINGPQDIQKLHVQEHVVDEEKTKKRVQPLQDAVGDILDINIDRRGALSRMWNMDISTDIAKLRGLEQIMYDAYDDPPFFHELLSFMQTAILKNIDQTQAAGDFSLASHQNQAMPFAHELKDPDCHVQGVQTRELWGFFAAQEYTTFGPELFGEFMLAYQKPIMERFGLVAYGCCEDLTKKIPLLRSIPNLRRIAVSPFADVAKCVEQIGGDYVISYRPNPSYVAGTLDEDFLRKKLAHDFDIFKQNGCIFDVTLKDVETVSGKPDNLKTFVRLVREQIDRLY